MTCARCGAPWMTDQDGIPRQTCRCRSSCQFAHGCGFCGGARDCDQGPFLTVLDAVMLEHYLRQRPVYAA